MPRAAFFASPHHFDRVFAQNRRETLESRATFYPHLVSSANFDAHAPHLRDVELIFATWGMPNLSSAQLDLLPNLRAVFYAAGSVQSFARPLIERGIVVVSGWNANGLPVAQWTIAQILLSNKGFFRNQREFRSPQTRSNPFVGRGNFGASVSLLGAGAVGRLVIELLRPFQLSIHVFDPFLSDDDAAKLGVERVSLIEAFERGQVVSNHLADLPATRDLLRGEHFRAMPTDATFINTGRGATVCEAELIETLQLRPDLTALLDVTYPEPPLPDSPLWNLKNVYLTSHLAGSIGDEVIRMADVIIEEFERWETGKPLRFGVSLQMLETMA